MEHSLAQLASDTSVQLRQLQRRILYMTANLQDLQASVGKTYLELNAVCATLHKIEEAATAELKIEPAISAEAPAAENDPGQTPSTNPSGS